MQVQTRTERLSGPDRSARVPEVEVRPSTTCLHAQRLQWNAGPLELLERPVSPVAGIHVHDDMRVSEHANV